MNKSELLIIDDEAQIRKLLSINLENNGYKISMAENAREGIIMAANHPPDLILLDLGLPDMNGQEVLKELRSWYNNAIIILSVQSKEEDIVEALDNGASDYLTKPFRTGELLARIRSAIKRNIRTMQSSVAIFDDIQIDFVARVVSKNNIPVKLTTTEYNLLSLFAQNEGRVLTHQLILKTIWGIGYQTETQYLRVFVGTLRKKLEDNPNIPKHIVTESGVGYRFS
jgi:two-component system, OmpR family, KDP operon response regulator KdpE